MNITKAGKQFIYNVPIRYSILEHQVIINKIMRVSIVPDNEIIAEVVYADGTIEQIKEDIVVVKFLQPPEEAEETEIDKTQ